MDNKTVCRGSCWTTIICSSFLDLVQCWSELALQLVDGQGDGTMMAMFMHKFENFMQAKKSDLGVEAAVANRSPVFKLSEWMDNMADDTADGADPTRSRLPHGCMPEERSEEYVMVPLHAPDTSGNVLCSTM